MTVDDKCSRLPDGKLFAFWDCETVFTKTYYVSKAANASDANPGTKEEPFATINHAAQLLMPGERVVIGEGVYDELVQPARGGESAARMISYEAAPKEKVIITGAKVYKNGWTTPQHWAFGRDWKRPRPHCADEVALVAPAESVAPVAPAAPVAPVAPAAPAAPSAIYEGHFEQADFDKINPFSMVNHASHPWVEDFYIAWAPEAMDWMPLFQRRGLLFCDGALLKQVSTPRELADHPGSYWVEDSGFTFLLHLKDAADPAEHVITYTCREQLFAPKTEGCAYIRVSGLGFEFVGNGVPGTQKGMLSTRMGHHWIIENNTLRWANSLGIDIGMESTIRDTRGMISGGTIVRGNQVSHCGICGITGLGGNNGILIENNRLTDNCWLDLPFNWESASIKVHGVKNGLIRFNTVMNTLYGDGIWTDWGNVNERICYNFVLNTQGACHGGIFVEASDGPNRVDHNVIFQCKTYQFRKNPTQIWDGGHGIATQDSNEVYVDHNIILGVDGESCDMRIGSPERIFDGHGMIGAGHRVTHNIMAGGKRAIIFSVAQNFTDGNLIDLHSMEKPPIAIEPKVGTLQLHNFHTARRYLQWEENGRDISIAYAYRPEADTGAGAAVDTDPDAGVGAAVDTDPDAGVGAAIDADPGAGVSAAVDTDPGAGAGAMTILVEIGYNGKRMRKKITVGEFFSIDEVFAFVGVSKGVQ